MNKRNRNLMVILGVILGGFFLSRQAMAETNDILPANNNALSTKPIPLTIVPAGYNNWYDFWNQNPKGAFTRDRNNPGKWVLHLPNKQPMSNTSDSFKQTLLKEGIFNT